MDVSIRSGFREKGAIMIPNSCKHEADDAGHGNKGLRTATGKGGLVRRSLVDHGCPSRFLTRLTIG
jgi:hypothetical protein